MRRSLLIIPGLLVAAGAAAGGWHFLHGGDPMADARGMLRAGNLRGAQLVLRDFVSDHGERADAHLLLGEVQLRMGDLPGAEHELRQAAERGADEHAVRPLLAQALVGQRQAEAVLRDYKADGLDARQSADLHVARALAAATLHQPDLAREEVAAARSAAPESADVALSAARVLQALGDAAAASEAADAALRIAPHNLPAMLLHAQLLQQSGQAQAALAAYDAALAEPGAAPADLGGARVARATLRLQRGDDAGAREDVAAALKAAPQNPVANYVQALLQARAGQWKGADESLTAIGPVLDRFPRGDVLLAAVKMNVGEPQQALDAAERFNVHHPGDLPGAKIAAQVDLLTGHAPAALRALTPWSTGAAVPDVDVLALLSQAYAATGRPDEARAALQKAAAASGGNPAVLSRMANMALRQGNAGLASDMLQTALHDETGAAPMTQAPVTQADVRADGAPSTASAAPKGADTAAALVLTALRAGQLDRANAALDTLRQQGGSPELVDMLTGGIRLAQSDLAGARAAFESAAARNPEAIPPVLDAARVMRLQGDTAGAMSRLRGLLAKQPANTQLLGTYVDLALGSNDAADAVAAAEAAHTAAPGDPAITVSLATLYLRTKEATKALALADTLPPDSIAQLGVRADAERALGHEDAAITAWQALVAKAPTDVALRRRVVGFLVADKRDDAADRMLRDGLATTPNDPGLQGDAVTLAARRDGLDAGLARADSFARSATDPAARQLRGALLQASGKYADAATAFAQARATLPADGPPGEAETMLVRQAVATAAAGDKPGSLKLLTDWVAAHPDSPTALQALADNDLVTGNLQQASIRLNALLKIQPNNPAALNNLAGVEQQGGQLDAAIGHANRAYILAPGPLTADTFGWALLQSGRTADALVLLRQAVTGQPPNPTIGYHLGAALGKAGRVDEARTVLQPLVDNPQPFPEKAQAAALLQTLGKS